MELSTRILLCCPCFGEIVTVEGLAEDQRIGDSERTREKTHAFSRMSTSATQCAATLQGKRPLQKGTDGLPKTGKVLKGLEAAQQHNRLAEQ